MKVTPKQRDEIVNFINCCIAAEREACARVAEDEVGGPTAKIVADRIRARPPFPLPILSFATDERINEHGKNDHDCDERPKATYGTGRTGEGTRR